MTGMMQDNHLLQLGVTWDIYLRELLCHREEVLSGMRIFSSESVVFHLVFWVSSLLCCFGLCLCLGLFCFDFGRHLAFCFSPVLEQCENSWSKTKRFDDRQSLERARHELKKKQQVLISLNLYNNVRVWVWSWLQRTRAWFASMAFLEPSRSKRSFVHPRYDTIMEWASCRVAILTDFSGKRSCPGLRHPPTRGWTNPPCQRLGCMQGNLLLQWATLDTNLLAVYFYVVVKRFWVLRRSY